MKIFSRFLMLSPLIIVIFTSHMPLLFGRETSTFEVPQQQAELQKQHHELKGLIKHGAAQMAHAAVIMLVASVAQVYMEKQKEVELIDPEQPWTIARFQESIDPAISMTLDSPAFWSGILGGAATGGTYHTVLFSLEKLSQAPATRSMFKNLLAHLVGSYLFFMVGDAAISTLWEEASENAVITHNLQSDDVHRIRDLTISQCLTNSFEGILCSLVVEEMQNVLFHDHDRRSNWLNNIVRLRLMTGEFVILTSLVITTGVAAAVISSSASLPTLVGFGLVWVVSPLVTIIAIEILPPSVTDFITESFQNLRSRLGFQKLITNFIEIKENIRLILRDIQDPFTPISNSSQLTWPTLSKIKQIISLLSNRPHIRDNYHTVFIEFAYKATTTLETLEHQIKMIQQSQLRASKSKESGINERAQVVEKESSQLNAVFASMIPEIKVDLETTLILTDFLEVIKGFADNLTVQSLIHEIRKYVANTYNSTGYLLAFYGRLNPKGDFSHPLKSDLRLWKLLSPSFDRAWSYFEDLGRRQRAINYYYRLGFKDHRLFGVSS